MIDLRNQRLLVQVAAMVRQIVVAVRNSDKRIGPVAAVVRHNKRRDARGIGLKGQRQHVKHQPDLLFIILKHFRRGDAIGNRSLKFFRALHSQLDFAHGGQVFVQLAAVGRAKIFLELAGVIHGEIENALVEQRAPGLRLFRLALVIGGEQTVEHRARIHFGIDRLGFGFPGKIELVGATVTAVAGTRALPFVAA